ncbi:MAG TPA: glutaminase [Gammaproteobacteria bacterium]|nr:glutaminase [Gammaproteobacteria bacterium]
MNYQIVLDEIIEEIRPSLARGRVADYIPMLASVAKTKFGMAVQTVDGRSFQAGDAGEPFSIQSISKVYTLTLALKYEGEALWKRVGREPSGTAFNSLVQLEYENGIPRNPFINAGAIVISDIVRSRVADCRRVLLDFVRARSDNPSIEHDPDVARSERATGYRNVALANFIKSFGNLENDVDEVLDFYFYQCSLSMSCLDLARSLSFLANGGRCPWTRERLLTESQAKRINAVMLTCGTYDAVGDFAFRVGMPGKSGVGGGIVAVIPNRLSVAVWSPGLNEKGNSLAGTLALELFTTKTGISIF